MSMRVGLQSIVTTLITQKTTQDAGVKSPAQTPAAPAPLATGPRDGFEAVTSALLGRPAASTLPGAGSSGGTGGFGSVLKLAASTAAFAQGGPVAGNMVSTVLNGGGLNGVLNVGKHAATSGMNNAAAASGSSTLMGGALATTMLGSGWGGPQALTTATFGAFGPTAGKLVEGFSNGGFAGMANAAITAGKSSAFSAMNNAAAESGSSTASGAALATTMRLNGWSSGDAATTAAFGAFGSEGGKIAEGFLKNGPAGGFAAMAHVGKTSTLSAMNNAAAESGNSALSGAAMGTTLAVNGFGGKQAATTTAFGAFGATGGKLVEGALGGPQSFMNAVLHTGKSSLTSSLNNAAAQNGSGGALGSSMALTQLLNGGSTADAASSMAYGFADNKTAHLLSTVAQGFASKPFTPAFTPGVNRPMAGTDMFSAMNAFGSSHASPGQRMGASFATMASMVAGSVLPMR